jgi:hypothetical protein
MKKNIRADIHEKSFLKLDKYIENNEGIKKFLINKEYLNDLSLFEKFSEESNIKYMEYKIEKENLVKAFEYIFMLRIENIYKKFNDFLEQCNNEFFIDSNHVGDLLDLARINKSFMKENTKFMNKIEIEILESTKIYVNDYNMFIIFVHLVQFIEKKVNKLHNKVFEEIKNVLNANKKFDNEIIRLGNYLKEYLLSFNLKPNEIIKTIEKFEDNNINSKTQQKLIKICNIINRLAYEQNNESYKLFTNFVDFLKVLQWYDYQSIISNDSLLNSLSNDINFLCERMRNKTDYLTYEDFVNNFDSLEEALNGLMTEIDKQFKKFFGKNKYELIFRSEKYINLEFVKEINNEINEINNNFNKYINSQNNNLSNNSNKYANNESIINNSNKKEEKNNDKEYYYVSKKGNKIHFKNDCVFIEDRESSKKMEITNPSLYSFLERSEKFCQFCMDDYIKKGYDVIMYSTRCGKKLSPVKKGDMIYPKYMTNEEYDMIKNNFSELFVKT